MISDIDSIMKKLRGEIGGFPFAWFVIRIERSWRVKFRAVSFRGIPAFGLLRNPFLICSLTWQEFLGK
jgi:hypothetical protein